MKTYESIALGVPNILLPKEGIDLFKWAVIACDQYTSDPVYWKKVNDLTKNSPSSLNLIYPEVYLGEKDPGKRIARTRDNMQSYLNQDLFYETEGFVYIERLTRQNIRKGLIVCLDLEQYEFQKGASSLIRATEGTILDRIPPRIKIREGAPLEIPHIMVLIDDPENTVLGPLTKKKAELKNLYDFELMMDSGHLTGYLVNDPEMEGNILKALEALANPKAFSDKYGLSPETPIILYAMGDGNHSFATAKTIWEKTKENAQDKEAIMNSPLRYGLVELVNLHDDALVFEPIHRVLFELDPRKNVVDEIKAFYPDRCQYIEYSSAEEITAKVDSQKGSPHKIGTISASGYGILEVKNPDSNLPAGTLQDFLNTFMENSGAREVDYVHGTESVIQLGKKSGCFGFYLPVMDKYDLFKTVILDGATPRKTFSLGEAWEKRFYMEARKLS